MRGISIHPKVPPILPVNLAILLTHVQIYFCIQETNEKVEEFEEEHEIFTKINLEKNGQGKKERCTTIPWFSPFLVVLGWPHRRTSDNNLPPLLPA